MINDDYILNEFLTSKNNINSWRVKKITQEEIEYLTNRFKDSESIYESIKRIQLGLEEKPKCLVCGKPLTYPFKTYCSKYCSIIGTRELAVINTRKTKLERYGDENYNNKRKSEQTCLERYGVKHGWNNETQKQTLLNKYGVDNIAKSNYAKNKQKETCLHNYGVTSPLQLERIRNLVISDDVRQKVYNTKQKNHSFNKSKPEDECHKLLLKKYPDTIRHYKSELYPFDCDFYIPSLDLYIEYNGIWTHGNHPYNENSVEDNLIVEKWKNKNSKFYNNAIMNWTQRDVKKRNTAKENNLNYLEFWKLQDLKDWLYKKEEP